MDMDHRLGIIDEQHRELFGVFMAMQSHQTGMTAESMDRVLKKLEQYVFGHLTFEEKLMSSIGYPDIEQHLLEHNRIRTIILKHQRSDAGGSVVEPDAKALVLLAQFLEEWLRDHILSTDMKYRGFIQSQRSDGPRPDHTQKASADPKMPVGVRPASSLPLPAGQEPPRSRVSHPLFGLIRRNKGVWIALSLVMVVLLLTIGAFPEWLAPFTASNTTHKDQEVSRKGVDGQRDKKIAFFYEKNMKEYYCRAYLKIPCRANSLLVNPVAPEVENIFTGEEQYLKYCARCHGESGKGNRPDAVLLTVPLERLGWAGSALLEREAYLFWIIAKGGSDFGGSMPPFRDMLGENDIWKIILFLKTLR